MAKVPSYKEINDVIKKIADIPSKVDDEGFIIADGVSLTKNTYDPKNGNYELHVRDAKNNKWKAFDTEDGADCVERAAKCFVDFYKARSKSESRKFSCSMQKKKESLAKKSEGLEDESEEVQQMVKELAEKTGNDIADVRSVNSDGGETCLVFGDEEEYRCFADYSDAERASNDGIKDMLDAMGIEGIRFENIGGIEKFVNTDWFDAALREYAENYISDIKHEPGRYEDEYGDMTEEDAVEKFIDEVGGGDAVKWFKSDFGDDYFSKVVMDNNLVDVDALAEAITEADGPANELAVYDGKEIELPCGYYCYRVN